MGKILAIMSGRGGVGKTTTAVNLGFELSMLGKSILLVDENVYLPDLHRALGISDEYLSDFISNKDLNKFDAKDLIQNKTLLKEVLINVDSSDKLFFLPSCFLLRNNDTMIKHKTLLSLYKVLSNKFDYVLIDFPPGFDANFYQLLPSFDTAIIVTTSELASVKDSASIINRLNSPIASSKNKSPNNKGSLFEKHLIISKLPCTSIEKEHTLNPSDIEAILETTIMGIIPYDNKVIISTDNGLPMVTNKDNDVALAYNNIARRVIGEKVEFLNLIKEDIPRKSFFKTVFNR